MRRLEQVINIITNKHLTDSVGFYNTFQVKDKYIAEEAVPKMFDYELECLENIDFKNKTVVVLGSGLGREVNFFSAKAKKVIGIEPIEKFVLNSFKALNVEYIVNDHEIISDLDFKFDFLWITTNLPSLIVPEKKRKKFFLDLKKLTDEGVKVFIAPDLMELKITDRFFWVSCYLYLTKKDFKWGDTLRANFEMIPVDKLMYYHYYTEKSFLKYLIQNKIKFKNLNQKFYLLG